MQASNGRSAELDVPAIDNASHCSSASPQTVQVSARRLPNVPGCLPPLCTLIVGHTVYFARCGFDSIGYMAYMLVKGQSLGVSADRWPHSANTRGTCVVVLRLKAHVGSAFVEYKKKLVQGGGGGGGNLFFGAQCAVMQ